MAGGFVFIDPTTWHMEQVAQVASWAAGNGARLAIFARLSANICHHVVVATAIATPEVVLADADDSAPALREVLRRSIASIPALVLAGLVGNLTQTSPSLAACVAACLAWAPIPPSVELFCAALGVTRKVACARLRVCGLNDTETVLQVARLARASHHLLTNSGVAAAAQLAMFGTERSMRNAFKRHLGAAPSRIRRGRSVNELAVALIAAATRSPD